MVSQSELHPPAWTDVLDAVKAIAPEVNDTFTVLDVHENMVGHFSIDHKKTGQWISKFVEWGYVGRGEFEESKKGKGRPARIYFTLPSAFKERTGRPSQISRLILAIYDVQGAPQEETARALQQLYQVRDEIEEEIANRFIKKGDSRA